MGRLDDYHGERSHAQAGRMFCAENCSTTIIIGLPTHHHCARAACAATVGTYQSTREKSDERSGTATRSCNSGDVSPMERMEDGLRGCWRGVPVCGSPVVSTCTAMERTSVDHRTHVTQTLQERQWHRTNNTHLKQSFFQHSASCIHQMMEAKLRTESTHRHVCGRLPKQPPHWRCKQYRRANDSTHAKREPVHGLICIRTSKRCYDFGCLLALSAPSIANMRTNHTYGEEHRNNTTHLVHGTRKIPLHCGSCRP